MGFKDQAATLRPCNQEQREANKMINKVIGWTQSPHEQFREAKRRWIPWCNRFPPFAM